MEEFLEVIVFRLLISSVTVHLSLEILLIKKLCIGMLIGNSEPDIYESDNEGLRYIWNDLIVELLPSSVAYNY